MQGNGTAAIFEGDDRVTTFDMHGTSAVNAAFFTHARRSIRSLMAGFQAAHGFLDAVSNDSSDALSWGAAGEKNYPWNTRMRCTYDVGLPDATMDDEYLRVLGDWLPRLFERHRPQLAFFQAGVDAMKDDSFGRYGSATSQTKAGFGVCRGIDCDADSTRSHPQLT